MRALRLGLASLSLTIAAAACGARSSLFVGEPPPNEGGGGSGGEPAAIDAGPDVLDASDASDAADAPPPVNDCEDEDTTFIYLVTAQTELYSFNPANGAFVLRGTLDCVSSGSPFSMAVDRTGIAYVVYNDGQLFRVSTLDAACEGTDFVPGQEGFEVFGMGFSTDQGGPTEQLFVGEINFMGPSLGLATIDVDTMELGYIGPFSDNPGWALEMTGTGDGRLFGYFLDNPGPGGHVVEIDKATATILQSTPIDVGISASALAFAFWGGDFYIFTSSEGPTDVTRYRPSDGSITLVATLPSTVVGAGVSTCAPTGL